MATALAAADPASAEAEQTVLAAAVSGKQARPGVPVPVPDHGPAAATPKGEIRPGVFLDATVPGRLVLSGSGVDAGFGDRLLIWLQG